MKYGTPNASALPKAADLLNPDGEHLPGPLIIVQPLVSEVVETTFGTATAVRSCVWVVHPTGTVDDPVEILFFWSVVIGQLLEVLNGDVDLDVVVGHICKAGKAYILIPPTADEANLVAEAVTVIAAGGTTPTTATESF